MLWLIGFSVMLLLFLLTIFCRWTYESDGTFRRYNAFNQETVSCPAEDLTELTVGIYKGKYRKGKRSYYLSIAFELDGGEGSFSLGDFSGESFEDCLAQMYELKEAVPPDRVFYMNPERLERYLRQIDPSSSEREWLYQIFDKN